MMDVLVELGTAEDILCRVSGMKRSVTKFSGFAFLYVALELMFLIIRTVYLACERLA